MIRSRAGNLNDQYATLEDYFDLGSYRREVTTKHPDAQKWFDHGLIWSYAFNHEESALCFERAAAIDTQCALAYWGLAYSLGPNYNKPWHCFDDAELAAVLERTRNARKQAEDIAAQSPIRAVEKALIGTLQFRYPGTDDGRDRATWNLDYADSMQRVYADFPDDLDVATIYADALMNLTPWKLWDIRTGKPAEGARTMEINRVIERALALPGGDSHPGLLHLYIHLKEMSLSPESALTMADKLRGLVPDAGHLNHMPSHLDVLCGDYRSAVASNSAAIRADEKFLRRVGPLNFYTLYRSHDYHFRIYGALSAGLSKVALETAKGLEASIPEDLLRVASPPMADWLEGFLAMRVHVLVRFGLWEDILDLEEPKDPELYCATTAMILYAKGVALSATGKLKAAEQMRHSFLAAAKRVPSSRTVFNNTCVDVLAIASAMLDGEIEYRRGNMDQAFTHLRRSIELDDNLPYDEPWGWMQPTRHAYGALLLEQGRVEEAVAVYSADLGYDDTLPRAMRHPNNVWALHGFHECLVRLGRDAEARIVEPQLRMALAVADVSIKASCYCRMNCHGS